MQRFQAGVALYTPAGRDLSVPLGDKQAMSGFE